MISNNFCFKTCAIIGASEGKVNFVIQTKHLKGESSKSARKTAKVKQAAREVASQALSLCCTYYNLALMHRLFDIFLLFLGLFSVFAV